MDVDFTVQDTFALTRPQWKIAPTFDDAGRAFAEMVKQNYNFQESERTVELEEPEDVLSGDDADDEDLPVLEMEDGQSSADEADSEVKLHEPCVSCELRLKQEPLTNGDARADSDFEEDIVVTRQQEQRDPEAEAEFDRELQKMMAESMESRKFERKHLFDVPLPIRRTQRPQTAGSDGSDNERVPSPPPSNTMAFSLMTKKGNKQQVRTPSMRNQLFSDRFQTRSIEMPSDSQFAISMRNQQEAEREEQRRIKSHILNLDFQDSNADGTGASPLFDPSLSSKPNLPKSIPTLVPLGKITHAHDIVLEGPGASDRHQHNPSLGRSQSNTAAKGADKSGSDRRRQGARKLQLSDVDWYE